MLETQAEEEIEAETEPLLQPLCIGLAEELIVPSATEAVAPLVREPLRVLPPPFKEGVTLPLDVLTAVALALRVELPDAL